MVRVGTLSVIVLSVVLVVREEVPPIVRFPLCVMEPPDASTRLPVNVSA